MPGHMNFSGDKFPLKMKNQSHSICKRVFLTAKLCCLLILLGLIILAKTICGVLVFYQRGNCSCWVLSWGTNIMRRIIRGNIILGCNYIGGNYPGRNNPGVNFQGENCPVTQRNRRLWEKIKHKIMSVKTKILVTEYVSWFNRTIVTITCKNSSLRNLS